jgi:hypothetical protein
MGIEWALEYNGNSWALELLCCRLGDAHVYNNHVDALKVQCERQVGFKPGSILSTGINVPVVYMARDLMILMWATSITRAIGRGGP